ncbi:peptidoglycan-binding protein [Actinophytocola sp.]|uniref:peptidoglycan-binding protein n=1 Tax=Actinophytocola sp. TaxID=1872138 RepID=UPI00389AFE92
MLASLRSFGWVLGASGVVGSKTWEALVGTKFKGVTGNSLDQIKAFSLQPGERNQQKVIALGDMLMRIYPYNKSGAFFNVNDPVYGPQMQKFVRDFQKRAGIKASGVVGPKTVAAMNEVVSVFGQWGC